MSPPDVMAAKETNKITTTEVHNPTAYLINHTNNLLWNREGCNNMKQLKSKINKKLSGGKPDISAWHL